jgi:hypothetical protein
MGSRRKTLLTKPTSGEHLRFTMNQDIRGVLICADYYHCHLCPRHGRSLPGLRSITQGYGKIVLLAEAKNPPNRLLNLSAYFGVKTI